MTSEKLTAVIVSQLEEHVNNCIARSKEKTYMCSWVSRV